MVFQHSMMYLSNRSSSNWLFIKWDKSKIHSKNNSVQWWLQSSRSKNIAKIKYQWSSSIKISSFKIPETNILMYFKSRFNWIENVLIHSKYAIAKSIHRWLFGNIIITKVSSYPRSQDIRFNLIKSYKKFIIYYVYTKHLTYWLIYFLA